MEIQTRTHLSEEEMQQVLDLLYTCHKADKTISTPYLENTYQFDKSMPYLFLAYEENRLFGFLSVYADVQDDVNVSLFVLPSVRKQGIASALIRAFAQTAQTYQLQGITYETERVFIEHNPWLLPRFKLVETDYAELWLRRESKPYELALRDDCHVVLAQKEMIEAIAKVQAAAFQKSFDNSEQYARASLEGEGTFLYVLLKDKEVIASVTIDFTSDYYQIFGLAVAPAHQGQGLGSYLMKNAINDLLLQSDKGCQIVVEKSNLRAASLYRNLGFTDVTEVLYLTETS